MSQTAETLLRLAAGLMRDGRRREAIEAYRRLLAARPDLADSWYNLGFLLKAEGRYEAALEAYRQALARGVADPEEVHLNRAVIYTDHLRRDDAAEAELRAALKLNPAYLPALLNLGNLHEEKGERAAAIACYQQILAAPGGGAGPGRPHAVEALARLAQLRPPAALDDAILARLKAAAEDPTGLDDVTRANLGFALGRAYDALGAFDAAFAAFREANRLARRTGPAYSRAAAERYATAIIDAFPAPVSVVPPSSASSLRGPTPIFICGMFRSGSTLVEQALCAHDRVTMGGELNILHRLAAGALAPFPASVSSLTEARAAELAQAYRSELAKLFPEAADKGGFVTDKRPDNFLLIGLIKRLFPTAKIVHTVRHPLDTCLSVFLQHLNQRAAGYASDLEDIAHYFAQYRRLMAHWKRLYPDSIFDFEYDAFVREPRPALARLLAFLGLEWEDRCLVFHEQKSTVKTASYWQVRRPLYGDASGRWRHYEAHLGALRSALAGYGVLAEPEEPQDTD